MTAAELRARNWCGAACAAAQIAATAAEMVPWWALPFTLALTGAVTLPTGPVDQLRARLTRVAGVASVAAFTTIIAMRSISQGRDGLVDPTSTLRSLTEALVVLSLIMAPNARTPREHRVWLTVTLGVLVAAAAGGRTVGQGVMIAVSWVIVLIATNRVQVTDAYVNGAVPGEIVGTAGRERLSWLRHADTLIPIIATLVAGAIIFMTVPAGLGSGDLARRIARSVQRSNLQLADRDLVGVDTRGLGALSLLVRGELPDTPIIRVPESSPELWRATFYRAYTGTEWTNGVDRVLQSQLGASVSLPTFADDPPAAGGVTRTDRVEVQPESEASLIWAPGVPDQVSGDPAEIRGLLRGSANVRVIRNGQPLTTYTVRSVVPPTKESALTGARGGHLANAVWTALPSELPAEVTNLAREITARSTNRFEMVQSVENYLRDHETYSLDAPVPGRGKDAVDDFLFNTHVGFCELFASAEAVLLRSVGVPARLVSGLAYGVPQGKTRLFTAKNAHAWVEVYYPGVGWSPSDPTAGVALADAGSGQRSLLSRAFDRVATIVPGGRLALAVVGAGLLVALGGMLRRLARGRGRGRSRRGAPRSPGPVLAAFQRMAKSRHGPPPRAPAETPRQYLLRVGGARPDVDTAVLALEQELYGDGAPSDAEVRAAIETFASLTTPAP
ncbi:MAG TPA: transglutaminase domain-containing protein [Mycobacteriales bacterium]|jgi:transglutaminase-like putative cysteine protease|nr:transglutaminase domain-containing protein [Mycobacteriales bacterium]